MENDAFLQASFNEGGRNADPWQCFVIWLRYRGRDRDSFAQEWVASLLEEGLGLSSLEVPAIAAPLGSRVRYGACVCPVLGLLPREDEGEPEAARRDGAGALV